MKRVSVVDLFNVPYKEMGDKINQTLETLENDGKRILDVKVLGESLNKCAVFVMHEQV